MRRALITLGVAATLAMSLATPVLAAQPRRNCPAAFDGPRTIASLLAAWPQFNATDFEAFLQPLDANDDELLCIGLFPEQSAKFGEPFFVANFIDNVAR